MLKKITFLILLITAVFLAGFIFLNNRLQTAEAGILENVYGWAWSGVPQAVPPEKLGIGWIKFNNCTDPTNPATCGPTNYGVHICTSDTDSLCTTIAAPKRGKFVGYAYFDINDPNTTEQEIGWIRFDPPGPYPTCPITTCPTGSPNYPARLDFATRKVTGWARACNVFQVGCDGALKPDSERGGWDGWILLGPIVKSATDYGVSIDTSPAPDEFRGWAWGSDIIGWISFNRSNTGAAVDYKVMTNLNAPPVVTNPHETFNPCAWGTTPQVADGFSVILNWTYSDPEGDSQQAYEIWLDNDSSFAGAKFNYKVEPSASTAYTLNLTHDIEGDWLSQLAWNTTYYWKVKVKDSAGNWSESLVDSFDMPSHAYPNVDFEPSPQSPSVGELVQFCSVYEEQTYVDPDTGEEITEIICPTDLTFCYNATCVNWYWTFENGDPANSTQKNPAVTFSITGSNKVTLKVTDSTTPIGFSCIKEKAITSQLPLPEWKEIAPF